MREFGKAKRQEKLKSMMAESGMNGMPAGMPNGFPPLPPMFGGNANNSSRQPRQTNNDINIDDLVKKIDAKIAALEEEEKENAKSQDEDKPISNNSTKEILDTKKLEEKINEKLNANINSSIEDKSKLDAVDINAGNINNNDTTTNNKTQEASTISLDDEVAEDKFFDDFFDD